MIQATSVQRARLPLVAIAAFALGALAATSASHLTMGAAAPTPAAITLQSMSVAPPALTRPAEAGTCGNGAYITGDMAGDTSPASVYATLCPGR
jgi:hypothetical protein